MIRGNIFDFLDYFPIILSASTTLWNLTYCPFKLQCAFSSNWGFRFDLLTGRWTDEWTDWVRETDTQACQRRHAAGWRGRTEGASAGGFEEQPWLLWIRISPDAGGGPKGARRCQWVRGNTNGLQHHHLTGMNFLDFLTFATTPALRIEPWSCDEVQLESRSRTFFLLYL